MELFDFEENGRIFNGSGWWLVQRYFVNAEQVKDSLIFPNESQAHHMLKVMRMKTEAIAEFVIAEKVLAIAKLISVEPISFKIMEKIESNVEMPIQVSVATSFLKGDKLEFLAQKVTELGAGELIIVPTQRAVVKWDNKKQLKKQTRLQKIAQEASEQSHRLKIPQIQILSKFASLVDYAKEFDLVLVAYEEKAKAGDVSQFAKALEAFSGQSILLFFGSEGGISEKEAEQLSEIGVLIGLGPRIMRAETAPLYVLSVLSYYFELKGG